MSDTGWVPDPRPEIVELADGYPHADYPKRIHWANVLDQQNAATAEQLMALMNGGIGEPETNPPA